MAKEGDEGDLRLHWSFNTPFYEFSLDTHFIDVAILPVRHGYLNRVMGVLPTIIGAETRRESSAVAKNVNPRHFAMPDLLPPLGVYQPGGVSEEIDLVNAL